MHHHELEPNVVDVTKNVTRKSFIFDHLNSDIKENIAKKSSRDTFTTSNLCRIICCV